MMDKNCGNCANYDRDKSAHTEACSTCISGLEHGERFGPTNWKSLPMTNADRIRAMSDEELEDSIRNIAIHYEPWCDNHCKMDGDEDCNRCLAKWLRQPAKEEST